MSNNIVITVGNVLMGDDGAGPHLTELCQQSPVAGWTVLDGGVMPEDVLYIVRREQPEKVLLVDAAEFGEQAGEIRIIDADTINKMSVVSTHSLPLSFLIDELKTFVPTVLFIGIQPKVVEFYVPMTAAVKAAVADVHRRLSDWQLITELARC